MPPLVAPRRIRAALVTLAAVLLGCSSPELKLCGQLPADGCPAGRGGTCDDAVCAALYDCVDGAWTIVEQCPRDPSGTGGGGAGGGGGGTGGGGPCTPVSIDRTGEKTLCTPDLLEPDCPAAAAEGCAETVCSTGCADFFLCTDDGWRAVAYCDEKGRFKLTP